MDDTIVTKILCVKNPFHATFYLIFTFHEVDNYFLHILKYTTEIQNESKSLCEVTHTLQGSVLKSESSVGREKKLPLK